MNNTLLPLLSMPNLSWAEIQDIIDEQKNKSANLVSNQIVKLYLSQTEHQDTNLSIFNINCGTGNYLIELAKSGYNTFGMDSDFQKLEAVLLKQLKVKAKIRLFHVGDSSYRDLRELDIIVGFDTSFYELALDTFEAKRKLASFKTFLKKGGMLIVETPQILQSWDQRFVLNNELPVNIYTDTIKSERDETLLEEVMTLVLNNSGESLTAQRKRKLKLWNSTELEIFLKEVGFASIERYSLYGRSFIAAQNTTN